MTDRRAGVVRVALVGGPMYDPLYGSLPAFERESGLRVEIAAQLPHPELNAFVRDAFTRGDADLDLLSTHTKYAPSQAAWLQEVAGVRLQAEDLSDFLPVPLELSRVGGRLLQVPRILDVRLLHYRRDLIADPPATWTALADTAGRLTGAGLHGFLFPGRDSGLFGTFYEMLTGAGGRLFDAALRPAFDSDAGAWAAAQIAELHHVRRVTPRELPSWHYDEISAAFRRGEAAMVCDWPGSFHLYRDPARCAVADRVGLAPLPAGPAGVNAAYGGCHSFAIAASARNADGARALLAFLTSRRAQADEARLGAIPCRASALAQVRDEAAGDRVAAERWRLLAEAQKTMIVPPRFARYPACEDAIWQSVQRAMVGEWTPRDAVARAARSVEALVATAPVAPS